jgi:hypothetical protein
MYRLMINMCFVDCDNMRITKGIQEHFRTSENEKWLRNTGSFFFLNAVEYCMADSCTARSLALTWEYMGPITVEWAESSLTAHRCPLEDVRPV